MSKNAIITAVGPHYREVTEFVGIGTRGALIPGCEVRPVAVVKYKDGSLGDVPLDSLQFLDDLVGYC